MRVDHTSRTMRDTDVVGMSRARLGVCVMVDSGTLGRVFEEVGNI